MSYSTVISVSMICRERALMHSCVVGTASSHIEREMIRAAFCDTPATDPRVQAAFCDMSPDQAIGVPIDAVLDVETGTLRGIFSRLEMASYLVDEIEQLRDLLVELHAQARSDDGCVVWVYFGLE